MPSDIHVRVTGAARNDVRAGLVGLEVSRTSPVSRSGRELGVSDDGEHVTVRCQGHDGAWTKTSQDAVLAALHAVPGVEEVSVVSGGYEPGGGNGGADAVADESEPEPEPAPPGPAARED